MNGEWLRALLGTSAAALIAMSFGLSSLAVAVYLILVHRVARELRGSPRPRLRVPLLVFVYLTSPIWSAAFLHYLEGSSLLLSNDADGSLGVAALLSFFHNRFLAASALFGASGGRDLGTDRRALLADRPAAGAGAAADIADHHLGHCTLGGRGA